MWYSYNTARRKNCDITCIHMAGKVSGQSSKLLKVLRRKEHTTSKDNRKKENTRGKKPSITDKLMGRLWSGKLVRGDDS